MGDYMKRREFLWSAGMVSTGLALCKTGRLLAEDGLADLWRTFEVTTRVEVLSTSGPSRIWVPTALLAQTPFQKTLANEIRAEGGVVNRVDSKEDGLGIIAAEFPEGVKPVLTATSRVATRDYKVELSQAGRASKENREELQHFLRPTKLLPTDGIVKSTATKITSSADTDVEKARAIYDWIVDNTFRDPKTRGCGVGDIRFMLESGDLGGKCADLNALFVGLARAAGLSARDVYGIRTARSEKGYKSLGASSANITKAQHCRAEVYLRGVGWFPVDPADVRKVVLEEPQQNPVLKDELVKKARARLFGSWEMNWMAYNFAHDVALPGSSGKPVGFFMYPQAETGEGRLDPLAPETFKYEITSREVTADNTDRIL
jgi:transglutaminase-like putative cysteine protease